MFVGKRPNRVKDDVFSPDVKGKGIVDMQIEVMRMLLKKHYQEKEVRTNHSYSHELFL